MKTVAMLAVAVLLAGCGASRWWPWSDGSGAEVRRVYPGTKSYACDSGKKLLVRYGPENRYVMIIYPEREFRLDADGSARGKYTNGRTVLVASGEEATLEESGTVLFAKCRFEPGG